MWDQGNYNTQNHLVGTNKGISAKVYETHIGRLPTIQDMKSISTATASSIYKRNYWDRLKASSINNQDVANILVDHGVTSGTKTAAKMIQKILNMFYNKNLVVDGIIGTKSLTAINSVDPEKLFNHIAVHREIFYKSLNQPTFLQGWLNRVNRFTFKALPKANKTTTTSSTNYSSSSNSFDSEPKEKSNAKTIFIIGGVVVTVGVIIALLVHSKKKKQRQLIADYQLQINPQESNSLVTV